MLLTAAAAESDGLTIALAIAAIICLLAAAVLFGATYVNTPKPAKPVKVRRPNRMLAWARHNFGARRLYTGRHYATA